MRSASPLLLTLVLLLAACAGPEGVDEAGAQRQQTNAVLKAELNLNQDLENLYERLVATNSLDEARQIPAGLAQAKDKLDQSRKTLNNANAALRRAKDIKLPTWYRDYFDKKQAIVDQRLELIDQLEPEIKKNESWPGVVEDIAKVRTEWGLWVDHIKTTQGKILAGKYDEAKGQIASDRQAVQARRQALNDFMSRTPTSSPFLVKLVDSLLRLERVLQTLDQRADPAAANNDNLNRDIDARVAELNAARAQVKEEEFYRWIGDTFRPLLDRSREVGKKTRLLDDEAEKLYSGSQAK